MGKFCVPSACNSASSKCCCAAGVGQKKYTGLQDWVWDVEQLMNIRNTILTSNSNGGIVMLYLLHDSID